MSLSNHEDTAYLAIRLLRLMDHGTGQEKEIKALDNILSANQQMLNAIVETLQKIITKKRVSSEHIKTITVIQITEILDGFVEIIVERRGRIRKFFDYLDICGCNTENEHQNLNEFDKSWDRYQRKYVGIKNEFAGIEISEYNVNLMNRFYKIGSNTTEGLRIIQQLSNIETTLQNKARIKMTSCLEKSKILTTNEEYKLFLSKI